MAVGSPNGSPVGLCDVYIRYVNRTQIYLSDELETALEERSKATGLSKSQLIRDAVRASYLVSPDRQSMLRALRESAGQWRRRIDGATYVERKRRGRLSRIHSSDNECKTDR